MNQIRVIFLCKYMYAKHSIFIKVASIFGFSFLMFFLGCLFGVMSRKYNLPVPMIEQLSFGLVIVVCLLHGDNYHFIKPVCPLVSRRSFAIYRLIEYLLSIENVMLLLVLFPFYLITFNRCPSLFTVGGLLVINCVVRLLLTTLNLPFKRSLICRIVLICSIVCCTIIMVVRRSFLFSLCFHESVGSQMLYVGTGFLLCTLCFCYQLFKCAGFDICYDGRKTVFGKMSMRKGSVIMESVSVLFRQYVRCPVYNSCIGSVFLLMLFGLSLYKIYNGIEYLCAAFFIGAYTLSMLQYSSSFMSKSPDFFYSLPSSHLEILILPFLIVNVIVTSLLATIPFLYIYFILEESILPIIVLWLFFCGPIAQILLLNVLFPVKVELWLKNTSIQNIVQNLLRITAGVVSATVAILIQIDTDCLCVVCGSISLVCIFFYKRYVLFLADRIRVRKFTLLDTLR